MLPFAYLSGDPEQEYFTDGMVEEIIRALSRIRWLFVIARNSSFTISDRAAGSDPSRFQPDHAINLGRMLIVRPLLDREPMEPRRDTVNRPAASRYRHYASSTPPSPAH